MTASFTARNIDPAAANAIHDDDVARQFGFAGALVPGVELWGRTASLLGSERLALRFRRPVYDGETVQVEVDDDGGVVLRGRDGQARAVGTCVPSPLPDLDPHLDPHLDPGAWATRPLPDPLLPPVPASLPVGPLGTVEGPASVARNDEYCTQVGDDRWGGGSGRGPHRTVHPGLLLRAVNLVLMQNVALGPWIHTASDVRLLGQAPAGCVLQVRAAVRATSVRSGHDEVRYDALVLADGVPVAVVEHTALYRLCPSSNSACSSCASRAGSAAEVVPMRDETQAFWEDLYGRRAQVWSGKANAALVREVSGLPPGRALDLGCGEGGDALWLAERGWRVTAIDISRTALERAAREAQRRGLAVDWLPADLAAGVPAGPYDLVSAQFFQSPVVLPRTEVLRQAAAELAPGGVLLVVGHAGPPPWADRVHDPALMPSAEQVLAQLALPEQDWETQRVEDVLRTATGPDGQVGELPDSVVRLRRR